MLLPPVTAATISLCVRQLQDKADTGEQALLDEIVAKKAPDTHTHTRNGTGTAAGGGDTEPLHGQEAAPAVSPTVGLHLLFFDGRSSLCVCVCACVRARLF